MIVITGGTGRLGQALIREFPSALAPNRGELELRDGRSVDEFCDRIQPSLLIHSAAMTDVRRAQQDRETCWNVNVLGTERLVEALRRRAPSCYFAYVSTACVFDGEQGNRGEEDTPNPKNFYAFTKLVGEYVARRMDRNLVLRTNFVAREPWPYPRAFTDRFGTYLYADDVARAIRCLVEQETTGLVHVAGSQRMSMYELAKRTTPDVGTMTMADVNIPLTVDMTLRSIRIPHFAIT